LQNIIYESQCVGENHSLLERVETSNR
jgi:hypothetical protein